MLILTNVHGQKEANIWHFGEYAGLDFNGGSPVHLLNGSMNKDEGCSSISDSSGNLLFYTSGIKVWNRNHVQMPNGSGLFGHESSSQSALIVPKPGSSNLYYIFTTDAFFYPDGLRYSVVDMTLQGGLGDVTVKNSLLHTPSTEKLTAVRHSNNTDIWVISHAGQSDLFHAYLVTSTGISAPVSSAVGTTHTSGGVNGTLNAIGCMKVSPDGSKLALAIYNMSILELFDFNTTTGVISNPVTFPAIYAQIYGIEFSPDISKLYFTTSTEVYQADLAAGSNTAIINSVMQVGSVSLGPFGEWYLAALQLGPDGKIYGTSFFGEYLTVINRPNAKGIECNFIVQGVWLGGQHCYAGLPGFVQSLFYSQPQHIAEDLVMQTNVSIYPNPFFDNINISLKNGTIRHSEVLDLKGVVLQYKRETEQTSNAVLSTGHLLPGIYLLRILTCSGTATMKVTKASL